MPKAKVLQILNPSKLTGTSAKTGKPWNIMQLEMEKDDGAIIKADTFDTAQVGDILDVEQDVEYHTWKASRPRTSGYGAKPAQNNEEVMQTLRMVYKELLAVKAVVMELKGDAVPATAPPPIQAEQKPWKKWTEGDTPATREDDEIFPDRGAPDEIHEVSDELPPMPENFGTPEWARGETT